MQSNHKKLTSRIRALEVPGKLCGTSENCTKLYVYAWWKRLKVPVATRRAPNIWLHKWNFPWIISCSNIIMYALSKTISQLLRCRTFGANWNYVAVTVADDNGGVNNLAEIGNNYVLFCFVLGSHSHLQSQVQSIFSEKFGVRIIVSTPWCRNLFTFSRNRLKRNGNNDKKRDDEQRAREQHYDEFVGVCVFVRVMTSKWK